VLPNPVIGTAGETINIPDEPDRHYAPTRQLEMK
jgi:hypothetical protein